MCVFLSFLVFVVVVFVVGGGGGGEGWEEGQDWEREGEVKDCAYVCVCVQGMGWDRVRYAIQY